jgi:hypothetical protein
VHDEPGSFTINRTKGHALIRENCHTQRMIADESSTDF